ncbi:MAG: hypothetical protein BGO69_16220 [Bacteroidetes bacterium 46-16]|nr:MAG: hypothetical protein BGO69_16220 [Bacteroidetes bacterium 46-16]
MKKLSLYSILLGCLLCHAFSLRAQQRIRLQFIDGNSNTPVNSVSIIAPDGKEIANSDKDGFVSIAPPAKYFIAVRQGYKPDTLRNTGSAVIRITPLSMALQDVYINNRKVRRILHSAMEYVVDYDFVGDDILVASYSGNNGRKAKLFLLNNAGDTLALKKFPDEPVALFKSCTGHYYCVCTDKLYPIDITGRSIALGRAMDSKILPLLSQCEQKIKDTYYYRYTNKETFSSVYSSWQLQDSIATPFYKIEQPADAKGNAEEMQEIMSMLQFGDFRGAAMLDGMRRLRNDISYRSLGLPIFRTSDSLVIFDFNKGRINYFVPVHTALEQTGIKFDPGKTFRVGIIEDLVTKRFYLYDMAAQTLEELDIHSGEKQKNTITLRKPFAEKVKVHNGDIYYLWQDEVNSSTRQLFVQSPY